MKRFWTNYILIHTGQFQKISITTQRGIVGEWAQSQKAKLLKGKYEPKLEFLE